MRFLTISSLLWILVHDSMGDDEEIGSREIYNGTISRKELGRIVGGSKARKGQYPWFARGIDQWGDYHGCGGVLIASDFILTASHCAIGFDTEAPYAFEVGSLCYNKNGNCGQKQEFRKVARVIPHPKYDGLGVEQSYDFALMKLEEPCTITPAKIDINNFDLSTNYSPGRRLWVVGYGKKGFQDSLVNLPKRLQHVQVNYWSQEECQEKFNVIDRQIHFTMLCALGNGNPTTDACSGDSGGPLYDQYKDRVVGLTSWGSGCASQYPGVYSRITSVRWWIKQKLCNFSIDRDTLYYCKKSEKRRKNNNI